MGINTVSQLTEVAGPNELTANIDSIYLEISYKDDNNSIMQSRKIKLSTLSAAFYAMLKPVIINDLLTRDNTWSGENEFINHITDLSASHALWS